MISACVAPQCGQMIFDSKITVIASRKRPAEHDQNPAQQQEACHYRGRHRTPASAGRASGDATAAPPQQQTAAGRKARDGNAQERELVRRCKPCHGDQPCADDAERT
jgi:hypothetical protein